MSNTPRSDNLIKRHGVSTTRNGEKAVLVSDYKFLEDAFALARQLESELAEARAEIESYKSDHEEIRKAVEMFMNSCDEKGVLIKQMLEALEKATNFVDLARARDELSSSNWIYVECIAAIEAAKGGKV